MVITNSLDKKWAGIGKIRQVTVRRADYTFKLSRFILAGSIEPPGPHFAMSKLQDLLQLRVRYSETDQMGTFYNSRALEWFECGRTELMRRRLGMSYAELEAKKVFLPLVEAHLDFQGGARYDDLLDIVSTVQVSGRAKLRFDVQITQHANGRPVVSGYTVHAFADTEGKPIRPPVWFLELIQKAAGPAAT